MRFGLSQREGSQSKLFRQYRAACCHTKMYFSKRAFISVQEMLIEQPIFISFVNGDSFLKNLDFEDALLREEELLRLLFLRNGVPLLAAADRGANLRLLPPTRVDSGKLTVETVSLTDDDAESLLADLRAALVAVLK